MSDLPPKDPQAVLPYGSNWADWLLNEGATISSFSCTVPEDSNLTIENSYLGDGKTKWINPGTTVEDSIIVVWLSGGVNKTWEAVRCHVVTAPDGKEDDHTLKIKIADK